MYVPVLIAILVVILFVFCAWRIVKLRTAEAEKAEEEERKARSDPNELR